MRAPLTRGRRPLVPAVRPRGCFPAGNQYVTLACGGIEGPTDEYVISPIRPDTGKLARTRPREQGGLALVRDAGLPTAAERADTKLLDDLRAGDPSALDTLLERYWPAVFGYALRRTGSRDVAADVAQDVFCRLWERRASWRAGGSVRGLLFRLARNGAVSQHRRQRARERATHAFAQLYAERSTVARPAESAELRGALDGAIAALPARRREVFLLRMMDDLSYDEIADAMGTSRQTVANQLSHALATLRRTLAHLLD